MYVVARSECNEKWERNALAGAKRFESIHCENFGLTKLLKGMCPVCAMRNFVDDDEDPGPATPSRKPDVVEEFKERVRKNSEFSVDSPRTPTHSQAEVRPASAGMRSRQMGPSSSPSAK